MSVWIYVRVYVCVSVRVCIPSEVCCSVVWCVMELILFRILDLKCRANTS